MSPILLVRPLSFLLNPREVLMVVEKEVGEIEANDTSTRRPVLSEVTSDATLPVNQAVNTFPRPAVEHDAGTLVFFLRSRIWDQINHTNSFIYG